MDDLALQRVGARVLARNPLPRKRGLERRGERLVEREGLALVLEHETGPVDGFTDGEARASYNFV